MSGCPPKAGDVKAKNGIKQQSSICESDSQISFNT